MAARRQSTGEGVPGSGSEIESGMPDGPASADSEEEEERPTHTAEIGTLKKLSVPGGTAWLGSSSGVYFVNTVRRAFSAAFQDASTNATGEGSAVPASEDILTGEDAEGRTYNGPVHESPNTTNQDFQRMLSSALGKPPTDRKLAMELVTTFFRSWHPLFPFLHGPRFLADMELLCKPQSLTSESRTTPFSQPQRKAQARSGPASTSGASTTSDFLPHPSYPRIDPRKLITFQLVINIASLDRSDIQLPESSRIKSTADVTRMAGSLALSHDIDTIQALLAAELYLVATIALRQASTIAGIVLRMIYHSGLHRCPLRYASLTVHDCEIRKRIFWSAYALDRHLSLALGDPNTFQDSDIDVCLSSSKELHRAVARDLIPSDQRASEYNMHLPRDHQSTPTTSSEHPSQPSITIAAKVINPKHHSASLNRETASLSTQESPSQDDDPRFSSTSSFDHNKALREAALTAYVNYGKLTGRIIEIFHKSINFRFPKQDAIGYLSADIENWWNDLPGVLTGESDSTGTGADEDTASKTTPQDHNAAVARGAGSMKDKEIELIEQQHRQLAPFFMILYQQLLLLLNRPRLSLDQSTAEFQQGLQICIRASRHTLSALKKHKDNGQSMFLPGLLSAAWMAGLIIAFACQLGKYPKARACADIRTCLGILEGMNIRWYTVKNCHKVLSLLLANITQRRPTTTGFLSSNRSDLLASSKPTPPTPSTLSSATRKRNRDSVSLDEGINTEPSPKRESIAGESPASSIDVRLPHFTSPPQQFVYNPSVSVSQPKKSANFDISNWRASTSAVAPTSAGLSFSPSDFNVAAARISGQGLDSMQGAGAALYADPQDMAFAQSNHSMGLPELAPSGFGVDDQMFWGNLESNMFDVFGAVSWESMTGPAGPMITNPNTYNDPTFTSGTSIGNDPAGTNTGRAQRSTTRAKHFGV